MRTRTYKVRFKFAKGLNEERGNNTTAIDYTISGVLRVKTTSWTAAKLEGGYLLRAEFPGVAIKVTGVGR